jgi:NAD(P)H-dependent flavin oxidoreductase YrpB (nitropropane dioxygenase family)
VKTALARSWGIEYPIFAFSHCRDVVAAVSQAGGVGVLGTTRQSVDELEIDLKWLDDELGPLMYGVDLLFPARTLGDDLGQLRATLPPGHREFVEELRERFHIPLPKDAAAHVSEADNLVPTHAAAREKFEIAMAHRPRLVASALGPFPVELVEEVHARGGYVAGLVGAPGHATKHVATGADLIVAQGTEAGGHTGEITTLVLVPQVVDEVPGTPVVAAGGIGDGRQIAAALALGAQGVWTGSIWLATVESDIQDEVKEKLFAASSRDTVRSRCLTGKPIRQLRTPWVNAWDEPGAPEPLPAPQQGLLIRDTMAGIFDHTVAPLMGTAVGQTVGLMQGTRRVRDVMDDLISGFITGADSVVSVLDEE